MRLKTFRNLDEQVEILRSKGLIINDADRAKHLLYKENYFFLSGYRHLFMSSRHDNKFIKGATFDELYGVFVFDRGIRNIIFKYILIIENNIKSIISYELSRKYGFREKDYLNPKNFNQDTLKSRQVHDIINKIKRQVSVNGKQHNATIHYISNYGYIPMWVMVKVLSFGIVSELYNILKIDDQRDIARSYNLSIDALGSYLTILSNFRNLCAHEDILYDHRTQRTIPNTIYHKILNIDMTDNEYNYGKNDLFAVIIIMKDMLDENEFRELIYEIGYDIDVLDGKVDSIPLSNILNRIGFPDNWRNILDIKKNNTIEKYGGSII